VKKAIGDSNFAPSPLGSKCIHLLPASTVEVKNV